MKIPFGTITITEETKQLVNEVLDSGNLSCGAKVREFEKQFANLVGTKEAVAVSSGTDALIVALATMYEKGANRGDEVLLPAMTFVGTANAVLAAGFTPVFVDVEPNTLNIDPSKIESKITYRTIAILPVHLMGKPAKMDEIIEIADWYKLQIIEDAAEAHGAIYKGKNVGALGNMCCYSLYVAHIITSVEGGIVTTDDSNLAEVMRSLRSHGRACKCNTCVLNKGMVCQKRFTDKGDIRFLFERPGFSCKMNEMEAAVGLASLSLYQDTIDIRHSNLLKLIGKFKQFDKYLSVIEEEYHEQIGPHAFPILIKPNAPFSRNDFTFYLNNKGIDTRDLFSCIPTQCKGFESFNFEYAPNCRHRPGDFLVSEYIGTHGLHIGVHQEISDKHIEYITQTTHEFLEAL